MILPGGGDARSTVYGAVNHGKSVIVLHNHTSHRSLCCAPIGVEGSKGCMQPISNCKVQAH